MRSGRRLLVYLGSDKPLSSAPIGLRGISAHMYVTSGKRLTTEGAKKMMATAVEKAKEAGIAVSIAITDAGGHLILLERMEGGRFHSVHSATTKAVCAASNKRMTSARGAQAPGLPLAPRPGRGQVGSA